MGDSPGKSSMMADLSNLLSRIDAEFAASDKQIKEFQTTQIQAHQGRQERLELFVKACEHLRGIWKPRLEALAQKFGDKVKATPTVSPTSREATFQFNSPLADISLRFSATTDADVRRLVLDYNLHILPILMKFEPHIRVDFPLEEVNSAAVAQWIDDRIVDFVKTYLSLHHNEYYLKGHMVSDPISGTMFPKYAAAATLDWQGKTYYFIGDATRREFSKQKGVPS